MTELADPALLVPGSNVYAGMKAGVAAFSGAPHKQLGPKEIKVCNVECGKTHADLQYQSFSAQKQAQKIDEDWVLRAEDIAVGVHYVLTHPRWAVVQQVTIAPRTQDSE